MTLTGSNGQVYEGAFNDISLKGMLFWSDTLPPADITVQGSLALGEEALRLCGRVLWSHPERGAAIAFQDLDVESFGHLRMLVSLNMGDAEQVDRELFSSL